MNLQLTEQQEMLRAMARSFAEGEIAPIAHTIDAEEKIPDSLRKKLRDSNFFALLIPEEYGGVGVDAVGYVIVMEELARASAAVAITVSVHNSVAAGPIAKFGTDAQKSCWLPRLAKQWLGAFALTEPGSGSDSAALTTRAERRGEEYVLNGSKTFVTNGKYADVFVLLARTSQEQKHRGITAFLIERNAPGLKIGKNIDKMGIRGSDTVELVLEDCRVPAKNRLHDEGRGFRVAMQTLDGGRIGVAAQALGIAQASLDAASRYARDRYQFGHPIGDFQAIQWMIAEMRTEIEGARLLTLQAAWMKDQDIPYGPYASMAKLKASAVARMAADRAVQIHGGYGYTKEFAVERYYRDAKVTELYEGTSEIQRIVIANSVLHPKDGKGTT
ncbi:MAG: acyl-CoA dehydrogenase [Candidatus Eisenbacteria bacterium]|uniref:Acyl-CoA dehydrogenase n=1 Tax=Eiseniibacteriota bacterium TaxID=2212470 RepID=A0A538TBR4_UNCEI|nr:MAG: acyl-CoA dehydrogenase [Candidatus Eisenbacteria bacterium]TMQ61081.1 MAG: acyl-CoA dehydrogenase [Candidatus Eisenbacteria bacterium]